MQVNFSPSINILRDSEQDLFYINTNNANNAFNQIFHFYKIGIRAFNIIGSYGTGKSAFLLAFEKQLRDKNEIFKKLNGNDGEITNFKFINIIGNHGSIIEKFTNIFNVANPDNLFTEIDEYETKLREGGISLVIVIDEFGKYLEYAAQNNSGKEIYFIQQLAEFVNDKRRNALLITVLHQNFDDYAVQLDKTQRNEWEKVKGRLKELTFNEPIEQLLYLASEYLKSSNKLLEQIKIERTVELIKQSKLFPLKSDINYNTAANLFPLDLLSAALLTLALQRYGQNERSLFSFLKSDEHKGLENYEKDKNPFYNINCVYDYLIYNYYSFISTKNNPDYLQWAAIRNALERIEANFNENLESPEKIVKTIGLLNIFSSGAGRLNRTFLEEYSNLCLNISNPSKIIDELENKKIIRYQYYKDGFVLFEGTDIDIQAELIKAESKITTRINVVKKLNEFFSFPLISAKANSYKKGTPRLFDFRITETPIDIKPNDEIDGIINLIFNETIELEEIKSYSANCKEAILFGLFLELGEIKEKLLELEKVETVINSIMDDQVAISELRNLKRHLTNELDYLVRENIYDINSNIVWLFNGEAKHFNNNREFNSMLSQICEAIYPSAPIYKNELINRQKTPAAITTARKKFFNAIVNNWIREDLGFPREKYPPEKTIYLTLLKETGIHKKVEDDYTLGEPDKNSFKELWQAGEDFLSEAQFRRISIDEFIKKLSEKPFKLKRGFLDFWIPLFLFIKRDDFALYGENGFIPNLDLNIIDLINRSPHKFQLKSFSVKGLRLELFNRYRSLLNQKRNFLKLVS